MSPALQDVEPCVSCRGTVRVARSIVDQRTSNRFTLGVCRHCGLVRVLDPIDEETYRRQYDGGTGIHVADALTKKTYDRWLAVLEPHRQTGRLLEVGFGSGGFLQRAQQAGWEVYGTEVGDMHVPALVGDVPAQRLHHGYLEDAPFAVRADAAFDVAILIEVLEHVPRPDEMIEQLARLVRPGGALFITVPNYDSLSRIASGSRWREYNPPAHLSFFTPVSLRELLQRRGFSCVATSTTGFNVVNVGEAAVGAVRGGRNPGVKDASASADEKRHVSVAHTSRVNRVRRMVARLGPVKSAVNSLLTRTGRGDSLRMLARRDPD